MLTRRRRLFAGLGLFGLLALGAGGLSLAWGQIGGGAASIKCNQIRMLNADSGTDPSIESYGCDTNVGIRLVLKGSGALTGPGSISLSSSSQSAATTTSFQTISGDFNVTGAWGSSTATSPNYGAGGMFNTIVAANLSATKTIIGGLIGKIDAPAFTFASTYPAAVVIGEVGDLTTGVRSNFQAVLGGDTGVTTATAAYSVDVQNSTNGTGWTWGLDLQGGGTHDSYVSPYYTTGAPIRLGGRIASAQGSTFIQDICLMIDSATPTNGTSGTGAGNCGPGSLHLNTSDAKLRSNTNTKASPTWTIVGTQS